MKKKSKSEKEKYDHLYTTEKNSVSPVVEKVLESDTEKPIDRRMTVRSGTYRPLEMDIANRGGGRVFDWWEVFAREKPRKKRFWEFCV